MARKVEARATRTAKAGPKSAKAVRSGTKPASAGKRKPAAVLKGKPARKPRVRKPALSSTRATSSAEDALAVEALNRRYYDAFQSLDLEQIAKIWWHDEHSACIHPGWDARQGWAAVRDSYEEIFTNTRSIRFSLGDVRVRVIGDLAYVSCIENLVSEEGDSGDYLGAVLATNIFERRHEDWRMIHHHASPFAADETELPEGPLH